MRLRVLRYKRGTLRWENVGRRPTSERAALPIAAGQHLVEMRLRRLWSSALERRELAVRAGRFLGERVLVVLPPAQQVAEVRGRQRRAEVEALVLIAAHRLERVELLERLDALGDHLEPQAVRERDDRLHDRRVVGARHQVLDEAAIDLELVDRKAA